MTTASRLALRTGCGIWAIVLGHSRSGHHGIEGHVSCVWDQLWVVCQSLDHDDVAFSSKLLCAENLFEALDWYVNNDTCFTSVCRWFLNQTASHAYSQKHKPMMLRLLARIESTNQVFPDMLARCPWMYTRSSTEVKNTHDAPASKMQLLTE